MRSQKQRVVRNCEKGRSEESETASSEKRREVRSEEGQEGVRSEQRVVRNDEK